MNIQVLLLVALLSGGMIAAGVALVNTQIKNRIAAEVSASAEKTRADLAESRATRLETQLESETERQANLVKQLQLSRDREAQMTEVLEDRTRLDRLTQAKPGLIERQARKATTAVWEQIEDESRQ